LAHYFLINHDLRFIAVFSPKCACQTIGHWFLNGAQPDEKAAFINLSRFAVKPADIPTYGNYHKVLFLRDPLRRLVSFYSRWVIRDVGHWCFADHDQRFSLQNKSFRQMMFVLEHLSNHGLKFQHHLQSQTGNVGHINFDRIVLVEDLSGSLERLNQTLGTNASYERLNRQSYNTRIMGCAADHEPPWFRQHGIPTSNLFFDGGIRAIAETVYKEDFDMYRTEAEQCVEETRK
jgi:hypothetical protein